MASKVRKVVFPVAGLGSRFLPATKSIPKEMLPVVDRPLIDYAVEEARKAGIDHFVFVTGRGKGAIEDYFDHAFELETTLSERNKDAALKALSTTQLNHGSASFVRQQQPLGLGHAVWCARDIIGNDPFAVILPDELVLHERGCLAQMVDAWNTHGGNIVAVAEVPADRVDQYGIVATGTDDGNVAEVTGLVEKPKVGDAPSQLAMTGRYILAPEIFEKLRDGKRGAGGEIQLTDAMAAMIGSVPFHAARFEGTRFDCGDKAGFLAANIAYALERDDIGPRLKDLVPSLKDA
ncbi:MAG: UTP--glucose-1-phosphate uridylyltransferase GalU [Parvibaculaceae bacterium]